MNIHRLDLDVAIYRDRVQVTHRATGVFVDQRAKYLFSSETHLVEHPRFLEDTMVRAIRKILQQGGFALREPIAHIVGCDGELSDAARTIIEECLRETGMTQVIFDLP